MKIGSTVWVAVDKKTREILEAHEDTMMKKTEAALDNALSTWSRIMGWGSIEIEKTQICLVQSKTKVKSKN